MSDKDCPMSKRMRLDTGVDAVSFRDFDVIDEVQADGTVSEGGSNSSDIDLNEADIEDMLNEGLSDKLKNKKVDGRYVEKLKFVLEEKGQNHFEVLPEGWVKVTHSSGIPLYLQKQARVCTVSRPYFLGSGSVRNHQIPITAIPCLSYKKALEKEQEQAENADTAETAVNGNDADADGENGIDEPKPITTNAVIETVKENLEKQSLSAEQITEYCNKLFHFKEIRVMRFKSWQDRRKFTKSKKHIKNLPSLPEGTKLISFPNTDGQNGRQWIMFPNGKTFACILHEYVQHMLKTQPTYEFKEMEKTAIHYSATVSINSLKYGTGYGTSKKQAKSEAAREALGVLIPEILDKITGDNKNASKQTLCKDLSVFDEICIEDPRVTEFCDKSGKPLPHRILLTCVQRNFGLGDIKTDYQVNTTKHQKNEFKMTVGKHTVNVVCKNKKDGKHQASQAILQLLHPHIKTWGSLLRLYGNHSVESLKEKKEKERENTGLRFKAAGNRPNYAILEELRLEMSKLRECHDANQPIGTFMPSMEDLPMTSGSSLNNVLL